MTSSSGDSNPSELPSATPATSASTETAKGAETESVATKPPTPVFRETIESFAVALILAFLFRAFVAEAFVIPTGSMAPTLMGAHKDVVSPDTGFGYQCGASSEFDNETGGIANNVVVGTTDPLSRFEQPMLLGAKKNHTTFSGDRILVSKFSYLWKNPDRWDVIVFKYPTEARQNYIKRCIGLPNETIRIQHGDIYIRKEGEQAFEIARKPPRVVQAMLQPVSDTDHLSSGMTEIGIPNPWQPSPAPGEGNPSYRLTAADTDPQKANEQVELVSNGWRVAQKEKPWVAELLSEPQSDSGSWIRYYHRVLSPYQWDSIRRVGMLPAPIHPYSSSLISDFTAYNASINAYRNDVYVPQSNKISPDFATDWKPLDIGARFQSSFFRSLSAFENDGMHWTGDLSVAFDLELGDQPGKVVLDLVEAGVHYLATVDTKTGEIVLTAEQDGRQLEVISDGQGGATQKASCLSKVRAGKRHRIQFANVDNVLNVWVDGRVLDFSPSNIVVSDTQNAWREHRPKSTPDDPLDAAPVGLGVISTTAKVHRAQVWRDVYYIAAKGRTGGIVDDRNFERDLNQSVPADVKAAYMARLYPELQDIRSNLSTALYRDILFSTPQLWDSAPYLANRAQVEFKMGPDQFFPLGDNSAASSDGRAWVPNHFVPRRLLIGRAIVVFWPHVWMEPIPYWPNFQRMGLIR